MVNYVHPCSFPKPCFLCILSPMAIKLLATDMDDTLLAHDLSITPGNKEALEAAEDLGVHIVLASGRSLFSMNPYVKSLGIDSREGYVISWNGSLVTDARTQKPLFEHFLETSVIEEVVDWCAERNLSLQTQKDSRILVINISKYSQLDVVLSKLELVESDRAGFLSMPLPKLIIPGDPEDLTPIENSLKAHFGDRARLFRSKPYFLEIMPPESDKGLALAHLAQILGLKREEVMAIGDAGNDKHMIEWAGTGVAMANGTEEVRQAADWVTSKTNDEDGFAEAVHRFVISPKN